MNRRTFTTRTLTAIAGLFGASRVSAEVERLQALDERLEALSEDVAADQAFLDETTEQLREKMTKDTLMCALELCGDQQHLVTEFVYHRDHYMELMESIMPEDGTLLGKVDGQFHFRETTIASRSACHGDIYTLGVDANNNTLVAIWTNPDGTISIHGGKSEIQKYV